MKMISSFYLKSIYSNKKEMVIFFILLMVPNILSMINLGTIYGFKIHSFQLSIFVAAIIYGKRGGALSGLFGSIYSAFIMYNPYIILGNIILGFFAGLFYEKTKNIFSSVILAFIIQLFWLIPSDYYFMQLSANFIKHLIISLFLSNLVWAIFALYISDLIKNFLEYEK